MHASDASKNVAVNSTSILIDSGSSFARRRRDRSARVAGRVADVCRVAGLGLKKARCDLLQRRRTWQREVEYLSFDSASCVIVASVPYRIDGHLSPMQGASDRLAQVPATSARRRGRNHCVGSCRRLCWSSPRRDFRSHRSDSRHRLFHFCDGRCGNCDRPPSRDTQSVVLTPSPFAIRCL
jgi:hypothetical protein